ncbi:glucosamine-6-phosphate deaminase [Pseudalgibacter alginicilyticus]|uniref:Glucosamine-6-phosphate deaminase n=1 Tax=Pseudalgibacter alginicilyticus TaxID=1736674 RepID=A0A0P0DAB4_9FLAO|nr:glucosamine-6-phosphate deaminase [Pseudalgibacter alginicilyticus]ALJ04760.1 glucosamine-6-phosphate deaminase [Pseudalgibacter alginicilyticus]
MLEFNQNINVLSNKKTTGIAAGKAVENCIVKLQKTKKNIRIVFAAAPSQDSMLDYLTKSKSIDWSKVEAFHMDEYIGLLPGSPQLFSSYLEENIFSKVPLIKHIINVENDISFEIKRYANLLKEAPIDIVCLGIGENGHLAFNDPHVADFNDPEIVKEVQLDYACRVQQVNDGCFESIDKVPQKAITLTIPTLLKGTHLFCVVLGANKSEAVKNALTKPLSPSCPASILTTHPDCNYYFDKEAYKQIEYLQNV